MYQLVQILVTMMMIYGKSTIRVAKLYPHRPYNQVCFSFFLQVLRDYGIMHDNIKHLCATALRF